MYNETIMENTNKAQMLKAFIYDSIVQIEMIKREINNAETELANLPKESAPVFTGEVQEEIISAPRKKRVPGGVYYKETPTEQE